MVEGEAGRWTGNLSLIHAFAHELRNLSLIIYLFLDWDLSTRFLRGDAERDRSNVPFGVF